MFLMLAPLGGPALAEGYADTYELAGGTVAVTNSQVNSVWVPEAALFRFDAATIATVSVYRVSQGNTFLLSSCTVTGATCAVWIAEAEYPFALGDVLRIVSSGTNGVVQVIRKKG
jgi:hypothetical protein